MEEFQLFLPLSFASKKMEVNFLNQRGPANGDTKHLHPRYILIIK
jgi:hypothetical protein